MRRLLPALTVLVLAALAAGCATSSDRTWVHPDTGAVPAPTAPDGR